MSHFIVSALAFARLKAPIGPIADSKHGYAQQNRRTDDPTEEDRSQSYSIKQQKTYTWKQDNIRTGRLPRNSEAPKKPETPKLPKRPKPPEWLAGLDIFSGSEVLDNLLRETKGAPSTGEVA